jgi:hypothetical protein
MEEKTYDVINDPLSQINDFWGKHGIIERFIAIFTVVFWAYIANYTLIGNYKIEVLQEVSNVATIVILAHVVGVNGLVKIGDTLIKWKYGNLYMKENNNVMESK